MRTLETAGGTIRVFPTSPCDLDASLASLSRFGDDLVDRWDGVRLLGTVTVHGQALPYVAVAGGDRERPWLDVTAGPEAVAEAAAVVRARFPPEPPGTTELRAADPVLGDLAERFPGVRLVLRPDLLTALIHCISAQQVNLAWASTTRRRLVERFGRRHEIRGHEVYSHDADLLAAASVAGLRALQFTTAKAAALIEAARAVSSGRLTLAELAVLPDREVVSRLVALRGIGTWSSEWILVRTLGRPMVVAGDLGVRRAVGAAYLQVPLPSPEEVRRATAHWKDAAGAAQALLLHAWAEGAFGPLHGSRRQRA